MCVRVFVVVIRRLNRYVLTAGAPLGRRVVSVFHGFFFIFFFVLSTGLFAFRWMARRSAEVCVVIVIALVVIIFPFVLCLFFLSTPFFSFLFVLFYTLLLLFLLFIADLVL